MNFAGALLPENKIRLNPDCHGKTSLQQLKKRPKKINDWKYSPFKQPAALNQALTHHTPVYSTTISFSLTWKSNLSFSKAPQLCLL